MSKRPKFESASQASDTNAITDRLDHIITLLEQIVAPRPVEEDRATHQITCSVNDDLGEER